MTANELRAVIGAMSDRPWRARRLPVSCDTDHTLDGPNMASGLCEAGDARAIVALANHADAIVALAAACEELNHGSPRDTDDAISKIHAALAAVHAVGKERSDG